MNYKPLPSNPSSGKDSKLVSRLKGECWSLEQKEAIRETLTGLFFDIQHGTAEHISWLAFAERFADRALLEIEAITKGEEQ